MSEDTSLQNVNYRDQIELLRKYFTDEQIGAIILSALQKERQNIDGSLTLYRRACANDLKHNLNKVISLTRAKDFDKENFYRNTLADNEKKKEHKPRFKTPNEYLYVSVYKLAEKTGKGFTSLFYKELVGIFDNAQPNKADKNISAHYNNIINDIVMSRMPSDCNGLEKKVEAA